VGHRRRLLAGAIQYWLYSRQPCGIALPGLHAHQHRQGRMAELNRLIGQLASESEYFHTPTTPTPAARERAARRALRVRAIQTAALAFTPLPPPPPAPARTGGSLP